MRATPQPPMNDDRSDDPTEGPAPTPPVPFDPERGEQRFGEDEPRRPSEAISMDTDTFMAIPAPAPSRPFEPPEFDQREGRLGRSTAFFSLATALSRVAGLV